MISFAFYNYTEQKSDLEAKLNENAQSTLDRLSLNLAIPIWNMDNDLVSQTITSEMKSEENYAIIVKETEDENFLLGKKRDKNWNIEERDENINENLLTFGKDILSEDNSKLGTVELFITTKFKDQELTNALMDNLMGVLVINIVLLIALIVTMKFLMLDKIEKLVETSIQVSWQF